MNRDEPLVAVLSCVLASARVTPFHGSGGARGKGVGNLSAVKHLSIVVVFVASTLVGAPGCKSPEVESCEDFVSAAQECGLMSGDPRSELDGLCEDVAVECREYFACAAKAECKESGGRYTLDSKACTMPEGKQCLPSS